MSRTPVKSPRRYDSSARRRAADERRRAVLNAAGRRFLNDGYAATTVASIASDAGASVEMLYKAFGSKPGLVRALWESGLAGEGTLPAETRSDEVSGVETDPLVIIASWARLSMEVAPRAAPILLLVGAAAATDPDMASLKQELDDQRMARMAHNAEALARGGHLREGITLDHARDVLYTYSSPEIFEMLVLRRGWPLEDFAQFLRQGIAATLL
ncbi:MAG: TetR/AcrR family transcriptional regulator [Dermatophilaceae bacterium]